MRDVCRRELEPVVDETWTDAAGNLIGLLRGSDSSTDSAAVGQDPRSIKVLAHMDELSMLVKRIEPDGTLHLTQLGTMYPGNFGLGPVAVLGDRQTVCGCCPWGPSTPPREPTHLGDQARPGRQGPRLVARVCLHRPHQRRVDRRGRPSGYARLRGAEQALDRRDRRLHRLVLHGRPGRRGGAARRGSDVARRGASSAVGRVLRIDHERGDRRRRRLLCQPGAPWRPDAGLGGSVRRNPNTTRG